MSPASPHGHEAMVPALSNANHSQLHMYSSFTAGNDLSLLNTFTLGNRGKGIAIPMDLQLSLCLSLSVCPCVRSVCLIIWLSALNPKP
jgi:hypothetical protein